MSTDIHTLAGAYALDALSDTERMAFTRHLRECSACALEVAELRETAARLADLTATAPPASLRNDVLTRIGHTRQAGPGPSESPGRAAAVRWRRWTAAAVAAAIIAVGAGTATFAIQQHRVNDARRQAAQASAIAAVLAAPDATPRTAPAAGGGRVTVVISNSLDRGVALLSGMNAPGAGRAYQIWLLHDGGQVSAGVLAAGADHGTRLLVGVRGATGVGVTNEPAGGSATPTPPMVSNIPLE